jgi:tetratricopeptide (TPR) repeat protein
VKGVLFLVAALLLAPLLSVAVAAAPSELCLSDAAGLKVADARLFDGVGSYRGPRVSVNPEAQRYFEQGMVFGWGFNFAEAARSFRAATLRDPDCAMCRWGIAWAVGPSINHDMAAADVPIARDALVQAKVHAADARTRELVAALAERHPASATGVDDAAAIRYAEAMVAFAQRHPGDADAAVLAAEALMTAHAYDWWTATGAARPWTPQILALLEQALALSPDHPGAHHYRVHLYDESKTPEAALGSAQRLATVAPGVGHLVHMPSHVYLRIGRYHDAVRANQAAVAADQQYAAATQPDPAYAAGYVLHNQHFLWAAALWSGESALAAATAASMAAAATALPAVAIDAGTRQHLQSTVWLTDLRFGRWEAIELRAGPSQADAGGAYLRGIVAMARGVAAARQGEVGLAGVQLARLQAARREASVQKLTVKSTHDAADLLRLAEALLRSDLAAARGDWPAAISNARQAVKLEDKLAVDEPPVWQIPARHRLGQALLQAGQPGAAGEVFAADLRRHPDNAVALQGLAEAERRRGRVSAAESTQRRAQAAWAHADVPLSKGY